MRIAGLDLRFADQSGLEGLELSIQQAYLSGPRRVASGVQALRRLSGDGDQQQRAAHTDPLRLRVLGRRAILRNCPGKSSFNPSAQPAADRLLAVLAAATLPNCHVGAYDVRQLPMNPELQRALKRHMQWFGSYKVSGELKKLQVFLVVNDGQIEFLTRGDAYKVKRVRRNSRVVCCVGSKDGPAISGTAKVITDRSDVSRVYRKYWKAHPIRMAILVGLVIWVEMQLNKRVVVRVEPDDPNPLAGLTDPAN